MQKLKLAELPEDLAARERRKDLYQLLDICGVLLQDSLATALNCSPGAVPLRQFSRVVDLAVPTLVKLWGIDGNARTRFPRHETVMKLVKAAGLEPQYQAFLTQATVKAGAAKSRRTGAARAKKRA